MFEYIYAYVVVGFWAHPCPIFLLRKSVRGVVLENMKCSLGTNQSTKFIILIYKNKIYSVCTQINVPSRVKLLETSESFNKPEKLKICFLGNPSFRLLAC